MALTIQWAAFIDGVLHHHWQQKGGIHEVKGQVLGLKGHIWDDKKTVIIDERSTCGWWDGEGWGGVKGSEMTGVE